MLSLDQLKVFFTTTLIEGFYFGNDAFSWISEVQYDCLKRQRGITQVLKMAARHCVSLTKVHVSHCEFAKVHFCKKFSFFVE